MLALALSLIISACGLSQPVDSSLASTSAPAEALATFALVNGILIDGTGSDPIPDAVVVVQGSQIAAVGPRSQVEIPADAQIIDVEGGTILPGLIDAHVHYAYANAARWAQAGITTVRSLGEAGWGSVCDRKSVEGDIARVVSAGPIVTVPQGYPIRYFGSEAALAISSPEQARAWAEKLLGPDLCQDVIKVALESEPQLSDEELQAMVEVAHERNTIVSAHVTFVSDLKKALANDVDDMAHMVRDRLPDEVVDQMIAEDVYVVPTLKIFSLLHLSTLNASNLKRFVDAGGNVAVGTDYNNSKFPEDMYLLEMEAMQSAGMTPMQVIVAATSNGAHVCNLDDTIGTLESGKMADLLVVQGDPLENLRALADVQLVIHGGIIIRDEMP